jgi:antirestriction protein ArdC
MPWHAIASAGVAVNAITNLPYHGVNRLFLCFEAERHKWPNQWASFQQWKTRGASVKREEHGLPIVFYSPMEIRETVKNAKGEDEESSKIIPIFHYATVFNVTQVDNAPGNTQKIRRGNVNPIASAEAYITATKAEIRYAGDRAFYSPGMDAITIPSPGAFIGSKTSSPTEAFYSTILHELCHWTGSAKRLSRHTGAHFGDEAYAAEELVAEIGAAFACAKLGVTPHLREDHVQYVASWLKILKKDKRALFTAASAASRAVDFLDTLQPKGGET